MKLAVANSKGGTGKTVTAVHVAAHWAYFGRKVLVIDTDPQASLTHWLGAQDPDHTFAYELANEGSLTNCVYQTRIPNLHIVPASLDLANTERELSAMMGGELILSGMVDEIAPHYDAVLIDCVGDNGTLAWSSILAAENLLIPIEASYIAVDGVRSLIAAMKRLNRLYSHKNINLVGVVACRVRPRELHSKDCIGLMQREFGETVLPVGIRDSVKIRECPAHHQTVFQYAPNSTAAQDLREVADELLNRLEGGENEHTTKSAA